MKLHEAIAALRRGGVGVLPTDTLYGVLGKALSPSVVARIYRIKGRSPRKPFIILLGSVRDLGRFGVCPSAPEREILASLWPGKVSVVFRCASKRFRYLHRGTKTLAFRVPRKKTLVALLESVGPLAAPSANPEGKRPARTLREARDYFGNRVDFYISGGRVEGKPSTLVRIENGSLRVLRRGRPPEKHYSSLLRAYETASSSSR